MAYLYLIRHPQTQPDPQVPASEWGLSATGRAEVASLIAAPLWAGVAAIYTSDQHKTMVVGDAAATEHHIPHMIVPALGEAARDAWIDQDAFLRAQDRFFSQPDTPALPDWETAHDAGARFTGALRGIVQMHAADHSLAVVTHATVLTLYVAHLRGMVAGAAIWRQIGFAAVIAIDRATMQPVTDFITAPYTDIPT